MCAECSTLEKAHREYFQRYLHLTARKSQESGEPSPGSIELDAALSESVAMLNEAWQRLVEHRAFHARPATYAHPV